jgi:hypothetical protein
MYITQLLKNYKTFFLLTILEIRSRTQYNSNCTQKVGTSTRTRETPYLPISVYINVVRQVIFDKNSHLNSFYFY